jgi:hypothetical protein
MMPRGPKGEKGPADLIGAAVMVGRIATGEIDETATTEDGKNAAAVALGRRGGKFWSERMTKNDIAKSLHLPLDELGGVCRRSAAAMMRRRPFGEHQIAGHNIARRLSLLA